MGKKRTERPGARRKVRARRRVRKPIPFLGSLEEFIPYKLAVVANRISQSIGRLFDTRFNLQMPEWRILMALYAYGDMPFYEGVERTSMDKARVSRAQRRLVDLGLVSAAQDPDDRRSVIFSLSEKGGSHLQRDSPGSAQDRIVFPGGTDPQREAGTRPHPEQAVCPQPGTEVWRRAPASRHRIGACHARR